MVFSCFQDLMFSSAETTVVYIKKYNNINIVLAVNKTLENLCFRINKNIKITKNKNNNKETKGFFYDYYF